MRYRQLGQTGLSVSEIGFGCGSTAALFTDRSQQEQVEAARIALDAGINLFDTAFRYGGGASETHLGRTLRALGQPDLIIASKIRVEAADLPDADVVVRRAVSEAIERLGVERLDILQLHNRVSVAEVPEPEYAGTLSCDDILNRGVVDAFESVRQQGLVGHIGFSGLGDPAAVAALLRSARFETVQILYNVLNPSAGMTVPPGFRHINYDRCIDLAAEMGVGIIGIRALAGGALTDGELRPAGAGSWGEWARAELVADRVRADRLVGLRRDDETLSQMAIRFSVSNASIATSLVGFNGKADVEEAVAVVERGSAFDPSELSALRKTLEFS